MISSQQQTDFKQDGVVFLKNAFSLEWIDKLKAGLEENIANPSARGRIWDRDDQGRSCFFDNQSWLHNKNYKDFALNSPCAEIAGKLLAGVQVSFFYDAVFVRTPGTQFKTPWHQDEPYWSVEGFDTCSIWMPLVEVEKKSALEFVRGSHRWNKKYHQPNFGALTEDSRDSFVMDSSQTVPFPDVESNRKDYDIISWDMEPGDCVAFNARIIHGGSGNLSPERDLKVFNTQWLGDDVRVKFKETGMDPDHSQIMSQHGLKPGDRPICDIYPQIWSQTQSSDLFSSK